MSPGIGRRPMFQPTARFISGAMLVAGIAALGLGQAVLQHRAEAQGATVQAPRFVVDPLWPKPLPNNWLLGWTIGVWVDEQDYVWIIHRGAGGLHNNERGAELNPPIAECCRTAPPILVFNPAGDLVRSWGGPGQGYEWPQSNHGVHVDYKGNVWIGGNGEKDAHILKFTKDGKFLLQVGHFDKNGGSNDRVQVFQPDGTFVKEAFYARNTLGAGSVWDVTFSKDPDQRFMFLADGQNERVRVILRDTLEELTSFGDGGRQPGQFYGVHSIASDSKGNLYTTETYEGKRVQKFIYRGIASQGRGYQGVLWPRSK